MPVYHIVSNMPKPPILKWLIESYLQPKRLLLLYRWRFGMSTIEHYVPLHLFRVLTASNRADYTSSVDACPLDSVASCRAAPPCRWTEPAKLYWRLDRPYASFFHYKEYNEQRFYLHSIGDRIDDTPTWSAAPQLNAVSQIASHLTWPGPWPEPCSTVV
jgi:hypothetical protein